MPSFKHHTHCRVCGTVLPEPYLDLGEQPFANALRNCKDDAETKAPLAITRCTTCDLSQLTVVVEPEVLYKGYRFRSGASQKWVDHCEKLADSMDLLPLRGVLDIGANDGTMLGALRNHGWDRLVGVDSEPCGLDVVRGYWGREFAATMDQHFGLITAQNVFGHVDDPIDFLLGCKKVLAPDGRVAIEVPTIDELVKRCAFDTIYHEHLSYWNDMAMGIAASLAGLTVVEMERFPDLHGGTTRYWLEHDTASPAERNGKLESMVPPEIDYDHFPKRVFSRLRLVSRILRASTRSRKTIYAFGASAKGAVFLNALKNEGHTLFPTVVIDDVPEKQGLFMPGVSVPVVPCPKSLAGVDLLWILSWNNAAEIKERARSLGFRGAFLTTSPTVQLDYA